MTSGSLPLLVTIETDPTRFHGVRPIRPSLPGPAACEQLLSHVLIDLEKIFPDIGKFSIAMPGALYDQTQILRPRLPVFRALEEKLSGQALRAGDAVRWAHALDPAAPADHPLSPDPDVLPGLMLNLPVILSGEAEPIESLSESMEHRFLEEGQLSAHAAKALESHFGIAVNHARFMTVTDLRAMLKLQLEHFEFSGLWVLLDAAIEGTEDTLSVEARGGQSFRYRAGKVHCRFETFDDWAREGHGARLGEDADLAAAYAEWTREYRQYVTTLEAHGVPLVHHARNEARCTVAGDHLLEVVQHPARPKGAEVTEHASHDVGVIAVTVLDGRRQLNYYPLSSSGLNSLHRAIRRLGAGPAGFSYPGTLIYDDASGRLIADAAPKTQ